MAFGIWSEQEPAVQIDTLADLLRFLELAEAKAKFPVAVSLMAHRYRADILLGHDLSFLHLTPEENGEPYFVTAGDSSEGVDFWLHFLHHTWFEGRRLIPKKTAVDALRVFFQYGQLSTDVRWEEYFT